MRVCGLSYRDEDVELLVKNNIFTLTHNVVTKTALPAGNFFSTIVMCELIELQNKL